MQDDSSRALVKILGVVVVCIHVDLFRWIDEGGWWWRVDRARE